MFRTPSFAVEADKRDGRRKGKQHERDEQGTDSDPFMRIGADGIHDSRQVDQALKKHEEK